MVSICIMQLQDAEKGNIQSKLEICVKKFHTRFGFTEQTHTKQINDKHDKHELQTKVKL